ncbi:MAG: metallophosphatase family protein, partial [Acidobacteriota bacterium]|nr:metallophosphatase family protein [Acidobacteriota bacterium]
SLGRRDFGRKAIRSRTSTISASIRRTKLRVAIVSDIHGNLTAFEAVLADLRQTSPDLIFHGGDLADSGSSPVQIVDHIRELGWQGVVGNTDEMLFRPDSLKEFANRSPALQSLFAATGEMAAATREALGEDRLAWLSGLPFTQMHGPMALVHASPESTWRAPMPDASDAELASIYGPLGRPVAVHGHIHRSYIRSVSELIVANTGSVSLSHDGDRRAAYLLLDDSKPAIRRVEYNVDREIQALSACGLPHADWVARMLDSGRPESLADLDP